MLAGLTTGVPCLPTSHVSGACSRARQPHLALRRQHGRVYASASGADVPAVPPAKESASDEGLPPQPTTTGLMAWWRAQQSKSAELRNKLIALGPAAVLAYGLFDGLTYTIAFAVAFLGYEARTGLNPTQNIADLVKICILMWGGNNVTRPFRLAGAAALAPFMDRLMVDLQDKLKLTNKIVAFAMIVAVVAGICFSIVGSLFFSRWVAGN